MAKTNPNEPLIRAGNKALLAGLLIVVLCAAVWFMFTAKARHDAETAKKETAEASALLTDNEARLSDLKSGQQRSAGTLLTKAQELDAQLPSELDKVALATSVEAVATSSGLELTTMNPTTTDATGEAPATASGPATPTVYEVAVAGSPSSMATFLDQLTKMQPVVTVSELTMNATPGDAGVDSEATATMKVTAWTVTDPELTSN